MQMEIRCFTSTPFQVNSYLIEENGHLLIVDPILTDKTRKVIEKSIVDFAVLTHEHYDHILSVNEINDYSLFPVYCGQTAAVALKDPRKNLSCYSEFLLDCIPFVDKSEGMTISEYSCECDNLLYDNETLTWQGHELFIKETPGHSKGSICILLDKKYLFSGDTIFSTCETALRLPGGSQKDYQDITLKWLTSLSIDTKVFPGHLKSFLLNDKH